MDDNEQQELQDEIYEEVLAERRYQDEVWHGQQNSPDVWSDLMAEYAMGCTDRTSEYDDRTRWLKVAALSFAAIEAYENGTLDESDSVSDEILDELTNSVNELAGSVNTMLSILNEFFGFAEDDDPEDDEEDEIEVDLCEDCALQNFCNGNPYSDDCFIRDDQTDE